MRDLQAVYNLISNNQEWIYQSLDIHENPNYDTRTPPVTFTPDIRDTRDQRLVERQNPLSLYKLIGDVPIDFVSIKTC